MKNILILFFILTTTLLFSQSKVDSLVNVLPTLKEDSIKVRVYLDLFREHYRRDFKVALDYATKAEVLSKKLNLTSKIGEAKRQKGIVLTSLNLYSESEKELNEALLIFTKLEDKYGVLDTKIELSRLKRIQSRNEDAIKILLEALSLSKEIVDQNKEARIHNNLASIYRIQKQYKKSIESYKLALSLVRELNIKPGISACLTNLAITFNDIEDYEKALLYHKEALKLKKEIGDKLGESRVLNNIGVVYNNLKKYELAKTRFLQANELAKQINDIRLQTTIYYGLTKSAFGSGDFEQSIEMGNTVLQNLDSIPELYFEIKVHRHMSSAYNAIGKFEKAYTSAVITNKLSDSLYSLKTVTITNELEAKYQNEQKTKEIALLESQNDLQKLSLNKQKSEQRAIIIFTITLLLLAGLLYNQYRIKQKANKKLKELDRIKSSFFTNISHEFRTPLTLIKGPIELLEQNPEDTLSLDNIKMIRRNTNRVLNLVNQLLDLSKIDEGNLRLESTEGDVFKCLRAATSSFNSHAAQRNIDYRVQIPQTVLWASFDRDKLEKIVYNLISNAFKFSEDHATISFNINYDNQDLQIKVSDSGKGIPEDKLPFIFDRFYQADNSSTKSQEGSGIGLSLSKDLVELMDGTITASSELNKGSFFTIHIPIQEIRTRKKEPSEIVSQKNETKQEPFNLIQSDKRDLPSVLLVEDNKDMRHFIKEQLIDSYKVIEALHGIDGKEKALQFSPDLVITDLMMPKMDGVELCKILKTNVNTSHIPIIMLTAKAGIDNKIEGLETGADDYLVKPFVVNELLIRCKNLIEQRQKLRQLYTSHETTVDPKKLTVTSIDQKFLEQILHLLEDKFSEAGFGVLEIQETLAMSKTQLHRKLKALTGEAPGELLRNFRLKRAAQLLLQKADTVTQIAYKVGFNNLSYFAKCFKELYGITPSSYSNQITNK